MAQGSVTPKEVLDLLRRQPYVPLRIHMTDGKKYDIPHPEFVMVGRDSLTIGVPDDPEEGVVDHLDFCNLVHVVRIEPLASA